MSVLSGATPANPAHFPCKAINYIDFKRFLAKNLRLCRICAALGRPESLAAAAHQVKEVHIGFGGLHVL